MKYMGSKRVMLRNGLGKLLAQEVPQSSRFVDLFTGSGAVARHVAQMHEIPVLAADLQEYSVTLAGSVVCRNRVLDGDQIWAGWLSSATQYVQRARKRPPKFDSITKASVAAVRKWSEKQEELPITAAYGGHYFSASQALWLDALRANLPKGREQRQLALAALIQTASQCAASPGHTAQPFQPTKTGRRFIRESWQKEVPDLARRNLATLGAVAAKKAGIAIKADANVLANTMSAGDLIFIDPPYSAVHYSRFYHVLESIASGRPGLVSGVGRYPDSRRRPRSRYSVLTESADALTQLLETIANRGAKVIITFPEHECSNGLSGARVQDIASGYFKIDREVVASRFSSLGGTSDGRGNEAGRDARLNTEELMLLLRPR
ncbi:DNA adenine methylase [Bradyrhizobium manausense]|uniref:DNA adenine methylase n=1 Tax=Bradyrhizobium manausense TaxID=989370 RepID=UPI0009FA7EBA|nr:DNA adenine methylase [Bradyrhizobium manausense]